ncbi:MAG: hypothetical protein DRP38_09875 [Thermotogae bacterium]|nr:MAG: hypothetical protein DRP38_09875 [Thermotogota bacterium]
MCLSPYDGFLLCRWACDNTLWGHIKKEFKLAGIRGSIWPFFKRFLPWLLIGILVWSISAFKATDYYLSLYSFTMTESHLTVSDVFDDMRNDELYRFDIGGVKNLEASSVGLLKGYKLLDSKREVYS